MSDRNIYLRTIPVPEALELAKGALSRKVLMASETIPTHEAAGRVTAAPVHARYSSPTFHAAAMDGYAVDAETTFVAREDKPLALTAGKNCWPVNTGHPLPEKANCVIMIEHVVVDGDTVTIESPAAPWQHVRRIGEDIVATELLLPCNRHLSAYDVGALLSAGIYEIDVYERVRSIFLPTGDEVLDFRDRPEPKPGQVIESNSQVFCSLAKSWGVEATAGTPVPDDKDALKAAITDALAGGNHIVVVGAGSSAGSKDFTRAVFQEIGEVLVHGIAVMPGKPSLLGVTSEESGYPGRLLVGAPGYPVSAIVCFEELIAPLASWLEGKHLSQPHYKEVQLTKKVPSRPGMEELMRLAVGRVSGQLTGTPLGRGAGLITTMTEAQAVSVIPANSEGVEQGQTVKARLLTHEDSLEQVLVHVGSHDNTLDLLANELMMLNEPFRLVSSHAGSMGGINALKAGSALFAGCHLFDPTTNDFNFPFLKLHLPNTKVTVVNLAIRHQGLIVPKGNPLNINGVQDLRREDMRFINRQRGAGTRILLDYHLSREAIKASEVNGYDREEYTHMGVAVNVLTGAATCGMGINAAARALNLGFVPLARERYDLIIPSQHMNDPRMVKLLDLIRTEEFKAKVRELGGYETTLTGEIMTPGIGLGEG